MRPVENVSSFSFFSWGSWGSWGNRNNDGLFFAPQLASFGF
jgi:hypothetical protein